MVTQGNIDAIRARAGRFFALVDAEALAARKKAAYIASLPDWDSQSDTILERSLLPEALQTQAEFETQHANLLRAIILFAQGIDLDVHGLEFPATLRQDGESDDAYLLRLVNRYSLLSLGSLGGYEDQVRQLLPDVVDVRAVEHTVSRNVTLFALKENRRQLTTTEQDELTSYYARRDTKIAGISVRLVQPTVSNFYVLAYAVYSPRQSGADEVASAVETAVQAYLDATEQIGAAVWSTGIQDAAWVPEAVSVDVQLFTGDPDVTNVPAQALYQRPGGVWTERATNVAFAAEPPAVPDDDQYLVIQGTQAAFSEGGQTFTPGNPREGDIYQYDAGNAQWDIVGTNRTGRSEPDVNIVGAALIPNRDIGDDEWYYFTVGYPALIDDHATALRVDDMTGPEAPIPALAATASYTAATLWHGANIYVSTEAWP